MLFRSLAATAAPVCARAGGSAIIATTSRPGSNLTRRMTRCLATNVANGLTKRSMANPSANPTADGLADNLASDSTNRPCRRAGVMVVRPPSVGGDVRSLASLQDELLAFFLIGLHPKPPVRRHTVVVDRRGVRHTIRHGGGVFQVRQAVCR